LASRQPEGNKAALSTAKYLIGEIKSEVYRFVTRNSVLQPESDPFALKLAPRDNPKEKEYYSYMGKRIEKFSVAPGQTMVGFPDSRQRVPYLFARYGQQEPEKRLVHRTKSCMAGIMATQKNGTLLLKVTESTPAGDIVKTWEKTYPE